MSSDYHISPAAMARLVKGHVTRAEASNLVLHLQACNECLFAFRRKYRWDFEDFWFRLLGDLKGVEPPKSGLRRVSRRRHELEARAAKKSLRRLHDVAPEKCHLIVRNSGGGFSSLAGVQFLLEEARSTWHESPKWALHWAELALVAVEALPVGTYPLPLVADYTARAWSYLGNAQRLSSEFNKAESHLEIAAFWSQAGTRDASNLAWLWRLEMLLARDQRRFTHSFKRAHQMLRVFRRKKNSYWLTWGKIGLGITKSDAEDYLGASQCYEEVLRQRDFGELGSLARQAAHQNLAIALLELGLIEESWKHFTMARALGDPAPQLLVKTRLDWLEGRLLAKTARPGQARAALKGVRDIFLEEGAHFDQALVNLDLAKLSLTQGHGPEAREHAEKALSVFLDRGIQREANEATMLLCRALQVR